MVCAFVVRKPSKTRPIFNVYFQLKLACDKKKSLYLVEHKAHEKFVAILTKYEKQLPKCAIVNFSGTYEELEKYISMGFYIVVYGMYDLNHRSLKFGPFITSIASKPKILNVVMLSHIVLLSESILQVLTLKAPRKKCI